MSAPRRRWRPAYIGIGSNLDSPRQQVVRSVAELRKLADCRVTGVSSLYRSAPMGPPEQPDFVNAVAALLTTLGPHELLRALQDIENAHGRRRGGERWGPRTLDLDLLVFSDIRLSDDTLTVPHPGIRERNFVLLPLCELVPQLTIPGLGKVTELAAVVANSDARIEIIGPEST